MKSQFKKVLPLALSATFMAPLTQAADLDITIQNLTSGMSFTPILAVAHTPDASLFEVGEAASAELQAMAEGGSLDGLASIGATINADALANPAGGLLLPGMSTTGDLMTADGNTVLSVVAMILPTNDGFIGLDNWTIPTEAGTYTVYVNAYDAGTEANDEIRGGGAPGTPGMPVPPPLADAIGENGSGVTTTSNNMTVHIHPGNIGDADQAAGVSDVQNTVHRWLNPVAKVTIVVN
ncbi:spondin domain-containing protein [Opacimonas viscosa]